MPQEHCRRAVAVQEEDPQSVLNFARRLIAWRKTQPALVRGDEIFIETPEPVLAFHRVGADGSRMLCAFNLGAEPVHAELPADAGLGFTPLEGHGLDDHGLMGRIQGRVLVLPPHGGLYAVVEHA